MNFILPTTSINFSTDSRSIIFYGEDTNVAFDNVDSVRVTVNGDDVPSSYISFNKTYLGPVFEKFVLKFTVDLFKGTNLISVFLLQGVVVLDQSDLTVVYSSEAQIAAGLEPPSTLEFNEFESKVELSWKMSDISGIKYFNVYRGLDSSLEQSTLTLIDSVEVISYSLVTENILVDEKQVEDIVTGNIKFTKEFEVAEFNKFKAEVLLDEDNLDKPQYFVVSSVSAIGNEVFESRFSNPVEVVSFTIPGPTDLLPVPSRVDLAADFIDFLDGFDNLKDDQGNLPDVLPLTPVTSLVVNPVSYFLHRLYVLDEFRDKISFLPTLSQLDDADQDGVSDDPNFGDKARYASTFNISPEFIQKYIDNIFDLHASRESLNRKGILSSETTISLTWTSNTLPDSLNIDTTTRFIAPKSVTGLSRDLFFKSLTDVSITDQTNESFYQESLGRYRALVRVRCETGGSIGNISANAVNSFASPPPFAISVTNESIVLSGRDSESNGDLARRIYASRRGSLISSRFWLIQKILNSSNILQYFIARAGDPYLLRDYDWFRQEHIGGMTDIYVNSTAIEQREEIIPLQTTFTLDYTILARYDMDSGEFYAFLQPDKNHQEFMRMNIIDTVTSCENVSRGIDYTSQVELLENKFIRVPYRFDDATYNWAEGEVCTVTFNLLPNNFILKLSSPPVLDLSYVNDEQGLGRTSISDLKYLEPGFMLGGSPYSLDVVHVAGYNPVGGIVKSKEEPTLSLFKAKDVALSKRGVDDSTVTVEFESALLDPSEFVITEDTETYQTFIRLSPSYAFNTVTAKVNYDYRENFTVKYSYDPVVRTLHDSIAVDNIVGKRNMLVKRANSLSLSIGADIYILDLLKKAITDIEIRTAIARFESTIPLSNKIYQSNLVSIVDSNDQVSKVEIPFNESSYFDSTLDFYELSQGEASLVGDFYEVSLPRINFEGTFSLWSGRLFKSVRKTSVLRGVEGGFEVFGGFNFGSYQYIVNTQEFFDNFPENLRCLSFLRTDLTLFRNSFSEGSALDYDFSLNIEKSMTVYMIIDDSLCDMYGSFEDDYMGETDASLGGSRPRAEWIRNDATWVDTNDTLSAGVLAGNTFKIFRKFYSTGNHIFGGNQHRRSSDIDSLSFTCDGALATITYPRHGFKASNDITIFNSTAATSLPNGSYLVDSVIDDDTFIVPVSTTIVGSGTISLKSTNSLQVVDPYMFNLIFSDPSWSFNTSDDILYTKSGQDISFDIPGHELLVGQSFEVTKSSDIVACPLDFYDISGIAGDTITFQSGNTNAGDGILSIEQSFGQEKVGEEFKVRINPFYDKATGARSLASRLVFSFKLRDDDIDLEDYYVPRNQFVKFENIIFNYIPESNNE